MSRVQSTEGMVVNNQRCGSCPFNEGGCQSVRASVEQRCLTSASQLCHGTNNKTLCKGARDFQCVVFHCLGVIEAPTQDAWDKQAAESRAQSLNQHSINLRL